MKAERRREGTERGREDGCRPRAGAGHLEAGTADKGAAYVGLAVPGTPPWLVAGGLTSVRWGLRDRGPGAA